MIKTNPDWTAEVVGQMHKFRITGAELADACGYTPAYLSMVLNARKEFASEESRTSTREHIVAALDTLIARKTRTDDGDTA